MFFYSLLFLFFCKIRPTKSGIIVFLCLRKNSIFQITDILPLKALSSSNTDIKEKNANISSIPFPLQGNFNE